MIIPIFNFTNFLLANQYGWPTYCPLIVVRYCSDVLHQIVRVHFSLTRTDIIASLIFKNRATELTAPAFCCCSCGRPQLRCIQWCECNNDSICTVCVFVELDSFGVSPHHCVQAIGRFVVCGWPLCKMCAILNRSLSAHRWIIKIFLTFCGYCWRV